MDEYLFEEVMGFPLCPFMSHGNGSKAWGGKSVSDCLLPVEFKGERNWETADFEHAYPREMQERILSQWKTLGFDN